MPALHAHEVRKSENKKEENILDLGGNRTRIIGSNWRKIRNLFSDEELKKEESLFIAGFFLRAFGPVDNAQTAGE